jgi:DNA-binding NtrC family response regulator
VQEGEIYPVGSTKPLHVDVRFIAASHRDLPTLARAGTFREDLLYRLNTLKLEVPPLRQRPRDLPLLWNLFARRRLPEKMVPKLTPAVLELLEKYKWPGNVRELQSTVATAFCLMTGKELLPEHLEFDGSAAPPPPLAESANQPGLSLEAVKILAIRAALQRSRGNRTKAAEELGINRETLRRQIAEHGLEREGLRDEEEGEGP